MITVIHGDDVISSRNYFLEEKNKAKNPIVFDESNLSLENLVKSLEGGSLFGSENEIFIDTLFSGKTKPAEEIIDYLENNSKNCDIYIWENQEIKRLSTTLKNSVSKLFKLPQNLFTFLDSLKPGTERNVVLYHEALQGISEEVLFYMIVRQFRLMLALLEKSKENIDEIKRLAPWQTGKLIRQAAIFGKEKLLKNYEQLVTLDLGYKSGGLAQTLSQNIDIFLLDL